MAERADVWRIFTRPDGSSSMERITVELPGGRSGLFAGTGVQIVSMEPNTSVDWHVGPRRQMIATIAGEGEIETGDGQKLTVKAGTITLIEDLTGRGTSRATALRGGSASSCPSLQTQAWARATIPGAPEPGC